MEFLRFFFTALPVSFSWLLLSRIIRILPACVLDDVEIRLDLLQGFVTEEMMMKVIDEWFKGVKDLLDDGRVNGSQQ